MPSRKRAEWWTTTKLVSTSYHYARLLATPLITQFPVEVLWPKALALDPLLRNLAVIDMPVNV